MGPLLAFLRIAVAPRNVAFTTDLLERDWISKVAASELTRASSCWIERFSIEHESWSPRVRWPIFGAGGSYGTALQAAVAYAQCVAVGVEA